MAKILKKLLNHIEKIVKSDRVMSGDFEDYICIVENVRLIAIPKTESFDASGIEVMSPETRKMIARMIETPKYVVHDLPPVADIKKQIGDFAGRKRDVVVWSDGAFAVNGRYLVDAMTALNATVCYLPTECENPLCRPILLYREDDFTGQCFEGIMQINPGDHGPGVWWQKEI